MTTINLRAAEARQLLDAGRVEVLRVMRPQPHSPLHENCVTGAWGKVWYTNDSVGDPTIEHWKDMPCLLPAPGAVVACREPWVKHKLPDRIARVESRGAEVRSGKWCWVAVVVREEKSDG